MGPLPVLLYASHWVEGRVPSTSTEITCQDTVIMFTRFLKKTLLEYVLFYVDTKIFLNGSLTWPKTESSFPFSSTFFVRLHLWSPSTKHNLGENQQKLVIVTGNMKVCAALWVRIEPVLNKCYWDLNKCYWKIPVLFEYKQVMKSHGIMSYMIVLLLFAHGRRYGISQEWHTNNK